MKKIAENPFDSFTIDNTPDDFWECARLAIDWLTPYLNDNDPYHQTFVAYCKSYADRISADPKQPDDPITEEEWKFLVTRQRLIMTSFKSVRDAIVLKGATAQVQSHSNSQSERASKPRKLTEAEHKRIAKQYWDSKQDGSSYGVVKRLAGDYSVSQTTVQSIARKYKPH